MTNIDAATSFIISLSKILEEETIFRGIESNKYYYFYNTILRHKRGIF